MARHQKSLSRLFLVFVFFLAAPAFLCAEDDGEKSVLWVEDDSIDEHPASTARAYQTAFASRCSDGAALYLRRSMGEGESRLFLFKDGRPLHYWRAESGWCDWSLFSIACMKRAIVLWGEGGTGVRTFVLTTDQGRPVMTYLQGEGLLSAEETENQTILRFRTQKYSDDVSEYAFAEPFAIAERYPGAKEERAPRPIEEYSTPSFASISMKMRCYNGSTIVEAQSGLDEKGVAKLFIDASGREQKLSFLPTSGLCWEDKMILKGLKDGKPAAIIVENKPLRPEREVCGDTGPIMSEITEVAPDRLPPPWDRVGWKGLESGGNSGENGAHQ